MSLPVSIVIPTHNRKDLLLRNLQALTDQTYSAGSIEVIVVADGCQDGTADAVRNLQLNFPIMVIEQKASGAAYARNEGATAAAGEVLIFLDDDIEASAGLVQAHVAALEEGKGDVIIGYLPAVVYCPDELLAITLRNWWEAAFHKMRFDSYLFSYQNLTSGNFSIRKKLFVEVGGFNTSFGCQEDYELGLRLIKHGAQFYFEELAVGLHHETSGLEKSLVRKFEEGKAAVLFARHFPAVSSMLSIFQRLRYAQGLKRRILFFSLFHFPAASRAYVSWLKINLRLMKMLRKRTSWQIFLNRLYMHHFARGVAAATGSVASLKAMVDRREVTTEMPQVELTIDLKDGLEVVEGKIDRVRPTSITIFLGEQLIGSLEWQFGNERWRGVHLRAFLAKKFKAEVAQAIAFDGIREPGKAGNEKRMNKNIYGDARA